MRNRDVGRGIVRRLGLAAAAIFALSAATQQRAEALSLVTPGASAAAKHATGGLITEVQHGGHGGHGGGHGGGFHGGGGAHGGGFHGGGAAFHGGGFRIGGVGIHGGFRGAPVVHGGGYRHAYRPHFNRHHFHRSFYYTPSYYSYPGRYCRIVWTYYGPRQICPHRHYYRYW